VSDFLERIAKLSPKRLALLAADLNSKLDRLNRRETEPIAVIGMGCRFPDHVDDPDSFWRLVIEGRDAIREVPSERWDVDAFYDPDPDAPGKMSTRWGGFLEGVDQFDPEFFGISPREAAGMDPQQRLLLEVTWEALENAGQNPDRLAGSPTGVFVGVCNSDYFLKRFEGARGSVDAYVATGNAHSVASGRISYILGLKGPSLSVDTACSSSLTAVHLACQSLRAGECRMALAGGVNLILMPDTTIILSKSHMMSPDGRCKPFDKAADGFVRSEGCGIVSLKRLSDARADGDTILALIRGTACNQDGHSSGLTAPNGPSQVAIIREALANAGLQPGDVDFVEAHGTGTSLGDPIEARALAEVFGSGRASDSSLRVGSVKSNIGHAESAAGIAGLIKAILALRHGKIPPTLHLKELNPHIDWNGLAIEVPTLTSLWNRESGRRVAGVSSFGFSGSNAHVILSDIPGVEEVSGDLAHHAPGRYSSPLQLLPLSARDESALAELARKYEQFLSDKPDLGLADVCYTAGTGRAHFEHRLTIVAADVPETQKRLADFGCGKKHGRISTRRSLNSAPPAVAFMFTGQGSQYAGMGRELFATQPVFQRELEKCAEILKPLLDKSLLELLFGESGESRSEHFLDETQYTQPALFALEYALAAMWRSWGVEPSVVLGHSVGEYVAACVAGVFGLEDGLRLVTERGRLMATLPTGGTMAAVLAEESRVSAAIAGTEIAIACINGPANIVISGESRAMSAVLDRLENEGIRSRRLIVSHAFHSSLMDPILDPFQSAAERVAYSEPHIAIVSNVTGRIASPGLMSCSEYWRGHIRNPVQFAGSIRALRESGQSIFLEIGPHPVLTGMARMSVPEDEAAWGVSLDRVAGNWESLLESVSMLYLHGVELEWAVLHAMRQPKRIALPTYPFQRARYWLEQTKTRQPMLQCLSAEEDSQIHPFLGKRLDSPAIPGTVFELEMGKERPAFLNDHRIFGRLIMPSPAYIEMAMAGAAKILDVERTESLPCEIVDLTIREPLFLPDEGVCRIQLIFEEPTERGTDFRVCSKEPSFEATDQWRTHVTGSLRVDAPPRHLEAQTWNREEVWRRCPVEMDAGSYYDSLIRLGLEFGERFRGIVRIRRGDGEALAEIQLPESLANEAGPYLIHPALLDSCFHLLGAALPIEDVQNAYLLIGIDRFALLTAPPTRFWNHTVLRPGAGSGSEVFSGDIRLYDDDGRMVAEILGLHLKRATALSMARADETPPESWFYEIAWRERAISATTQREEDGSGLTADFIPTPVLLTGIAREELQRLALSESLGIYAEFIPKLEALSAAYIRRAFLRMGWSLLPGEHRTARELAEESGVLPSHRRLFERLIGILVEDGVLKPERDGWAVLKPLEVQSSDLQLEAELLKREFPACSAEVTLTARCAERLDEVLRGTCDPLQLLFPNGDFDTAHALYRTSPFARALNTALRHVVDRAIQDAPKDRLVRILEIGAGTGGTTSFLLPNLPADRTRYTFSDVSPLFLTRARDEFRNYPFAGFELLDIEEAPSGQGFSDRSFDVIIAANVFHATRDLRETLAHAATLLAPGGVLILLEGTRRQRWVDLTFGLTDGWWRFDDTDLRPDYALISAQQWKPLFREAGLEVEHSAGSPEELESVPQAILIGRKPFPPQKTDPVPGSLGFWVILSDTVGIAEEMATLISQLRESCVLVSKGTEYEFTDGRRATLDPLRALDFARLFSETAAARNGQLRGVLNLWPVDEEISDATTPSEWDASQARVNGGMLHATQGFLALQSAEISRGARLWFATREAQAVPSERSSKADSFQPIQALVWGLARVISLEQPARFGSVIDLDLRASPQDCAAAIWGEMKSSGVEEAVAYRNGRRLVPRVVRAAEPRSESLILRKDGSYLITGGLGGLGLQVAEWMTTRGAGHIVLLSRRHFPERSFWRQLTPEDANYRTVQRILDAEKVGTLITVAQGDVADENGMRLLFDRFGTEEPPLRGIIHAAVEMTTRPVGELDLELFQVMCRAKALGGWVLHRLTLHLDLDLFVLFSSTTALWGAAGLGHYAAANQALDLLAYWRRERGLPALSVNWGTWQEMRVASEADKEQFLRAGLHPLSGAQALDALERLVAADRTSAIVASVDWNALRSVYEGRRLRPLFDEMRFRPRIGSEVQIPSKSAGTQPDFRLQLQNASPARRRSILITLLRSQISSILGFDLSREIEVEQGLFDMGMDSLMSVELKGRLERSLGVPLPSTLTFNYPTIKALADYLLSDAFGFHSPAAQEAIPTPSFSIDPPVVTASDDLSEEELSELLLKKLAELE
jgi:acyl transferase domain-containing protein/NAD(P)-dependent dehydrogenase (short-subunit alcohol dehydrogenase family)/acyl carrier protein